MSSFNTSLMHSLGEVTRGVGLNGCLNWKTNLGIISQRNGRILNYGRSGWII